MSTFEVMFGVGVRVGLSSWMSKSELLELSGNGCGSISSEIVAHLEMVSSWFMDFSMNLGKTSVFKYQPLSFVFPKSTNKSFMAFPHQGASYSHDPYFS